MAGCVLRLSGHGKPPPAGLRVYGGKEGLDIDVGTDAEAPFEVQAEQAFAFLRTNQEYLTGRSEGEAELDFGVWSRLAVQPMQSFRVPRDLCALAAKLQIDIRISVYVTDDTDS